MKKTIALFMALTMTLGLVSCGDVERRNEYDDDESAIVAFDNVFVAADSSSDADDSDIAAGSASEVVTATSVTTTAEPETTTEQTTTTAPETTTTTTTTTTEAPLLLPTISGSGATMNGSVIINVTGDPNTGVITLDIKNNSDGALILFGLPTLVVDGYSVSLDNYANMTVMSNEVPANAKGLIELHAQPEQIKNGMRITGEVFSKNLGYHPDRNFDITLN